ncbi:MAG: N-acetylmuramic acid 6-phosphate etherase [Planctomycetota bacterium]|nr:N-acetylmuramic acid 6-phosphate etherase [Planctomycetota bacterium]
MTAKNGPRDQLTTERRNPASTDLDRLSVGDAFDLFQAEDAGVADAVARAKDAIVQAVELVAERLARGGRLVYVGAGTSGRLGVLDAAECPPTFLTDPGRVVGLIAGGEEALRRAVEGAEDDPEAARDALEELGLGADDVVFGISAGGTTPYVHAALAAARERGAATIFLACVPTEEAPDEADVSIRVVTGPEPLTGSTHLKAGTATKLVLNRVSTLAMVRLGKVHDNLMVDLDTRGNAKLVARGVSILCTLTGLDRVAAADLLELAEGRVKVAAVMHARGVDAAEARALLEAAGGFLRGAL